MSAKTIKIGTTFLIIALAIVGLMYTTLSEGTEYYKHVDEVMANPQAWQGKRLQLHGFVVDGSLMQRPNTLDYIFQVRSNDKVIAARYTGVVPDTFKDGAEVVLKGRLDQNGRPVQGHPTYEFAVEPNGVMAKCPSKYDPASTATGKAGS
jgi:cytochrome c-type biogenesis protein CcmE